MQATDEAEVTYQLVVQMGKRKYETELEYTRAQAEEINKMVVDSARGSRRERLEYPGQLKVKPMG